MPATENTAASHVCLSSEPPVVRRVRTCPAICHAGTRGRAFLCHPTAPNFSQCVALCTSFCAPGSPGQCLEGTTGAQILIRGFLLVVNSGEITGGQDESLGWNILRGVGEAANPLHRVNKHKSILVTALSLAFEFPYTSQPRMDHGSLV